MRGVYEGCRRRRRCESFVMREKYVYEGWSRERKRERERESFSPVILMNFRVPVDGAFSVGLHGWALAATTTTMGLVLRENGICYT